MAVLFLAATGALGGWLIRTRLSRRRASLAPTTMYLAPTTWEAVWSGLAPVQAQAPVSDGAVVDGDEASGTRESDLDGEVPPETTSMLAVPTVTLLGIVGVTGCEIPQSRRRRLTELMAYLATHRDRPRSSEEIRAAIWGAGPDGEGRVVTAESLKQALSRLRSYLGPEYLADAVGQGGYQLAPEVVCDWTRFEAAVAAAHQRRGRPEEAQGLRLALELVQGPPFAGVPTGSYSWAFAEHLASTMEGAISSAAHRFVEVGLAHGSLDAAAWAAGRGLRAVPTDEVLLADCITIAGRRGSRAAVDRAWRDAQTVLGSQARYGPVGDAWRAADAHLRSAARTV
ncbi:MAG: hypothetical protein JO368_07260 [Acidimicrobiales bacterium]|nr:hypothetical protein [Acidimicrobiales bacterium]